MNFKEYIMNEPDLITIVIDEKILSKIKYGLLSEGIWKDSHISGYMYRVDAANPQFKQKRHVHIKRKNKSDQVSWNDDGTRHDKHKFKANMSGIEVAKQITRDVLKLSKDIKLEGLTVAERVNLLLEHSNNLPSGAIYLKAF